MSNKLMFEEWKRRLQDECYNSDCTTDCAGCKFSVDKLSAWNFAQAQEQEEIEELKKESESLKKRIELLVRDNKSLEGSIDTATKRHNETMIQNHAQSVLIESLKKMLEKAEEVVRFYGDPEKWMIKTSDSWTKSNPRTYGDSELIENYKHPNKDWIGSIVVGGKRARAYLKENE